MNKLTVIFRLGNAMKKALQGIINIKNLPNIMKYEIKSFELEKMALFSDESLIAKEENNIIISLTTFSSRISDVHLVIESLGFQTVKASKIILWLDKEEFNAEDIPFVLKRQVLRGLEIKFCDNLRSYKKIIPTLDLYPIANVITVDDDVIYPVYFVENLIKESVQFPRTVIAYRAHKITYKKKVINKYRDWDLRTIDKEASFDIFPTGIGGILYPIGSLDYKDTRNFEIAKKLAPSGDDIWLKAMTTLNGFQSKLVSKYYDFDYDFIDITHNQSIGLANENVTNGKNDIQIKNVFSNYSLFGCK